MTLQDLQVLARMFARNGSRVTFCNWCMGVKEVKRPCEAKAKYVCSIVMIPCSILHIFVAREPKPIQVHSISNQSCLQQFISILVKACHETLMETINMSIVTQKHDTYSMV